MNNLSILTNTHKYLPYISIILGAIIAFLSGIFSQGVYFYLLSSLGLIVALLGQFLGKTIEEVEKKRQLERKLTPPEFTINLKYIDNRTYLLLIQSDNLIPFEFKVAILDDQNTYLSGIPLDWGKIYPKEKSRNFNDSIRLNKNSPNIIKLKFDYKSVWAEEMNMKDLSGNLYQRYRVSSQGLELLN